MAVYHKDLLGLQVLILGAICSSCWESEIFGEPRAHGKLQPLLLWQKKEEETEFYGRLKYGKPHALGQSCASLSQLTAS